MTSWSHELNLVAVDHMMQFRNQFEPYNFGSQFSFRFLQNGPNLYGEVPDESVSTWLEKFQVFRLNLRRGIHKSHLFAFFETPCMSLSCMFRYDFSKNWVIFNMWILFFINHEVTAIYYKIADSVTSTNKKGGKRKW